MFHDKERPEVIKIKITNQTSDQPQNQPDVTADGKEETSGVEEVLQIHADEIAE